MDYNTIILYGKRTCLTKYELNNFIKGDLIWGDNATPDELNRWTADYKQEAEAELAKMRCWYSISYPLSVVHEYALEYITLDSDGEFVSLFDHELAKQDLHNLIEEKNDVLRKVIEATLEDALECNNTYNVCLYENGEVKYFNIRSGECCGAQSNNWRKDGFLIATINGKDIKNDNNLEDDFCIEDLVDKIIDTAWSIGRSIND